MNNLKQKLSLRAFKAALEFRKKKGYQLWEPICINDIVESLDIILKFEDIKSAEGLYIKDPGPVIIVSTYRPIVRQNYTCAHELGHHVFEHGTRLDEFVNYMDSKKEFDENEFLVDCFAGFLLMPKIAVLNAFKNRKWDATNPDYKQIFTISGLFGVGYTTLIKHMWLSLKMLSKVQSAELLKKSPASIKKELLDNDLCPDNLVIIDRYWQRPTTDLHIGDIVVIPPNSKINNKLDFIKTTTHGDIYQSNVVGVTRISNNDINLNVFLRTSKKEFVGFNKYKHLEDN